MRLWDIMQGRLVRQFMDAKVDGDAVWRVAFTEDKCVVLCKRDGRTVMDVIGFSPQDLEHE